MKNLQRILFKGTNIPKYMKKQKQYTLLMNGTNENSPSKLVTE